MLRTPTVHVHGMADPGLHLHRRLLEQYCEEGSATLVEWDVQTPAFDVLQAEAATARSILFQSTQQAERYAVAP